MPARRDLGLGRDGPDEIDRYSLDRVFTAANSIDTLSDRHRNRCLAAAAGSSPGAEAVRVVLDTMQTGPAVRTYNIMIGERRRVAAALIAVP